MKLNLNDGDYVANRDSHDKNVLNPQCIIKVENQSTFLPILNPNHFEVEVDNLQIKVESANTYDCYNLTEIHTNQTNEDNNISNSNMGREQEIIDHLRLEHLNNEEKQNVINICTKYSDIFALKHEPLNQTDTVMHTIPMPNNHLPIKVKPYRLPEAMRKEVTTQVSSLMDKGIIEPSVSPWNAPILIIPKKIDASKERKFRLVVDFRTIN